MEENSISHDEPPTQDVGDDQLLPNEKAPDVVTTHIFRLGVVFEGGLAVIAWFVGWLCDFSPLKTLEWNVQAFIWGLVGTLPLLAGLVVIDRYPLGPLRELKQVVDESIVPLFRGFRIWQFAVLATLAGVGEELLFRGLLQGAIANVLQAQLPPIPATWIALAIASVVFGLMHPITRTYAFLCMLVGLYLGGLWIYTENLLVPIIIHAAYDFVALVYLARSTGWDARTVSQ